MLCKYENDDQVLLLFNDHFGTYLYLRNPIIAVRNNNFIFNQNQTSFELNLTICAEF